MDFIQQLYDAGFKKVIAVKAAECSDEFDHGTLLLAAWHCEVEKVPDGTDGWIHPYYVESQKAYQTAAALTAEWGNIAAHRPDIRLKPIFARLPMFSQGRNTLSYLEDIGSRFQMQIIYVEETLAMTTPLEQAPHELHCGTCRACINACPTGAIDDEGFHREKCLRNWMMSSQVIPVEIRKAMGSRLIGCDECQRCCPHNPKPTGTMRYKISLKHILEDPKAACEELKPLIGANMAIPNRVLSQACIMAGSKKRSDLLPELEKLITHPSPTVREHAAWAWEYIRQDEK